MAQMFIRFDDSGDAVSWLQLDNDGNTTASGHGPLAEVAPSVAGHRVIVLVPGEQVVLYRANVPGQKRRLLAQAVPYALEEQLADDVESLHFALGRVEGDQVAVAVVSHALMADWLARLQQVGIEPHALLPDYLSLPLEEGSWRLLRLGNTCIVRNGAQAGAAMDAANAAVYLELLVVEAGAAKPAVIKLNDFYEPPLSFENSAVEVQRQPASGLPLTLMARGYDELTAINLLQGRYSHRERVGQLWRQWRLVVALLGAWLLLQLTVSVVDQQRLSAENEALRTEVEGIYRDVFPEARNISNPKLQMERALSALRGGSAGSGGFSDLLGLAGQTLRSTANMELQRVSFKDGVLDVSLLIGDLQQLDQLKQKLAEAGQLNVEIQSATARGNQIDARLRIKVQS